MLALRGFGNEFFDHTEAATITPEAKPNNAFCTRTGIWSFMKKTNAEPSIVPSSGKSNPMAIVSIYALRGTRLLMPMAPVGHTRRQRWQPTHLLPTSCGRRVAWSKTMA